MTRGNSARRHGVYPNGHVPRGPVERSAQPSRRPPTVNSCTLNRSVRQRTESSADDDGLRSRPTSHSLKTERLAQQFDSARPENVRHFQANFPAMQAAVNEAQAMLLAGFQARVDSAEELLPTQATCCAEPALEVTREMPVRCCCIGFSGNIRTRLFECKSCQHVSAAHPSVIGFQRSSPTVYGRTWISMQLLRLFRYLQLKSGVAANGKALASI
jgi:hypothetical protein